MALHLNTDNRGALAELARLANHWESRARKAELALLRRKLKSATVIGLAFFWGALVSALACRWTP